MNISLPCTTSRSAALFNRASFNTLTTFAPYTPLYYAIAGDGEPRVPDHEPISLAFMTPEQAIAHPNWKMGKKISVDSATLMNKGLELIEAHYLFDLPSDRIEVVIHPQSVIHSLVAYVDGSVLAQLGAPDMRTPIAYTLGWPDRIEAPVARLNLTEIAKLTFEPPDLDRFPALELCREALKAGSGAPTILSAANEVAVQEFLAGRIGFLDIVRIVERTLERVPRCEITSLDDVYGLDAAARDAVRALIEG